MSFITYELRFENIEALSTGPAACPKYAPHVVWFSASAVAGLSE